MPEPVPIPGSDGASTEIDALEENEARDLFEKIDGDEAFLLECLAVLELLAEELWDGLPVDLGDARGVSVGVDDAQI